VSSSKKSHSADSFAEKPAQHAVLRPDMAVLGRDVLGRYRQQWRRIRYLAVLAWASETPPERISFSKNLMLSEDDFHQVRKGGARQSDAQATEQQQQRTGRPQNRIFIGSDELVDGLSRAAGTRPRRQAQAPEIAIDELVAPNENPILRSAGPLLLLLGRLRVALARASFANLMEIVSDSIKFFEKDIRSGGVSEAHDQHRQNTLSAPLLTISSRTSRPRTAMSGRSTAC